MADRYWVGGTATWNTTASTKWSATSGGAGGASVPTSADDVYFDAASGAVTVTIGANTGAKSINCTGFTGTLTSGSAVTLAVSGSITLVAGMTFSYAGTITVNATGTITSAGKSFANLIIDGVGATVNIADALVATGATTLTNGTIGLGSFTLSTATFSSNNSNTRVIAFGTGNITLTGNAATIWTTATITNFSYTGTPTVNATYSGSTGTRTISTGGLTEANALNFNITAGSDIVAGSSRFKNLNFTGFNGSVGNARIIYGNLTVSSGMTYGGGSSQTFSGTGTQLITTNNVTLDVPLAFSGVGGTFAFQDALTQGSTQTFTITNGTVQLQAGVTSTVGSFVANNANTKFLQSTTPGSQATISQASGTVTVADLTIRDSNAVGGASWTAYVDYENVDAGNNDGWNFGLSPPYESFEPPIKLRSFTQPRRF
jgi:hypothetical protein